MQPVVHQSAVFRYLSTTFFRRAFYYCTHDSAHTFQCLQEISHVESVVWASYAPSLVPKYLSVCTSKELSVGYNRNLEM